MTGLNLNGPQMEAMIDKIEAENKVTLEGNTQDGVSLEVGRTWRNGFGLAAYVRGKSRKTVEGGGKVEFKW